METSNKLKCPFCGNELNVEFLYDNTFYIAADCAICGNYIFKLYNHSECYKGLHDKIAAYLFYHKDVDKGHCIFIGDKSFYESRYKNELKVKYVSIEEIENWYPDSFSKKIDMILLKLEEMSFSFGALVSIDLISFASLCFVKRYIDGSFNIEDSYFDDQMNYIKETLNESKLLSGDFFKAEELDEVRFRLTPMGWKRVDELQKLKTLDSKNVFIAMSFADEMDETRETIKNAIIATGYVPRIMDEIEHNHQIVPEMLYEIRNAKFVIAELTGHNNGAYFEAGYALGIGKDVIQVCNKEKFADDCHFDVKQVNTIIWENQNDLLERLTNRIIATIE